MDTPICDFIDAYAASDPLRLHMPGHKGISLTGTEAGDITEIDGADVLYDPCGIIKRSEENAASLWNTGRTVYSAEGSSLAIRAMLYLAMIFAKQQHRPTKILAARNAHKTFITAAALLDAEVEWMYGKTPGSLFSCRITPQMVEEKLKTETPAAVYLTSPDYLGQTADVEAIARICHRYGTLLLIDNAHGAYLHFLPDPRHPIDLGADICCDSAHKTLPVLTGGAYLHLSSALPPFFSQHADAAMALFASTSPSYLILRSLDAANRYLTEGYRERLAVFCRRMENNKRQLQNAGYTLIGDEPLKLTVAPKSYGYTGRELAEKLKKNNIICEACDPDHTVMMFSPDVPEALDRLTDILLSLKPKPPVTETPPAAVEAEQVCSPRQALLSPFETLPVSQCEGRILAVPSVSCPPAIPIAVCGEKLNKSMLARFDYYGISECSVLKNPIE